MYTKGALVWNVQVSMKQHSTASNENMPCIDVVWITVMPTVTRKLKGHYDLSLCRISGKPLSTQKAR